MTDNDELITMLEYLKRSRSEFTGTETLLLNVKPDSFKFVIDETIIKIRQMEEELNVKQQKENETHSKIYKTLENMFETTIK